MDEIENEDHEDYTDNPYAVEAVQVAKAILDGSVSVFAGCSKLSRPLRKLYVDDESPFSLIGEIAGKLHEYPNEVDRHLWDAEVVARKDTELREWLALVKPDVLAACREVVRRFGEKG